jgi:hypothetical protein
MFTHILEKSYCINERIFIAYKYSVEKAKGKMQRSENKI